jgi:hypothetical protein
MTRNLCSLSSLRSCLVHDDSRNSFRLALGWRRRGRGQVIIDDMREALAERRKYGVPGTLAWKCGGAAIEAIKSQFLLASADYTDPSARADEPPPKRLLGLDIIKTDEFHGWELMEFER